jgi:uncharacterized protein with FMN-binding domain
VVSLKKVLKAALAIVIIIILIAASGIFYITRGLEAGSKVVINPVSITSIPDGAYIGTYKSGRWTNELTVTVKNHKITKIDVEKDVRIPKPEWREQLFNNVIEKQSLDVDIVSGATVTSKAYLKSIEDALRSKMPI